jgi:hypothetical protein
MAVKPYLRAGLLAFVAGTSVILILTGIFAGELRSRFVFAPRERAVESAIRQVADREKIELASRGKFVPFSNGNIERNNALMGLAWSSFPVEAFYFDASELKSGNLRLRALPRPDAVSSLGVRARLYTAELSAKGQILHSGWYPSGD